MKIYVVTSDASSTPLAEIRTDGARVEFIVDNTDGVLPQEIQGSFQRLVDLTKGSSHLKLTQPDKATVNLIRYVMDNGDVVEITSDGKTCMLNGELLDEKQKMSLFSAIRRGELKVARKSDRPTPVVPTPSGEEKHEQKPEEFGKRTKDVISLLAYQHDRQKELEQTYGKDRKIEGRDYEYSDDPEFSKALAYHAKRSARG